MKTLYEVLETALRMRSEQLFEQGFYPFNDNVEGDGFITFYSSSTGKTPVSEDPPECYKDCDDPYCPYTH